MSTYLQLEYGCHVGHVRRRRRRRPRARPRAIPLDIKTLRKSFDGFPFHSYISMGLRWRLDLRYNYNYLIILLIDSSITQLMD